MTIIFKYKHLYECAFRGNKMFECLPAQIYQFSCEPRNIIFLRLNFACKFLVRLFFRIFFQDTSKFFTVIFFVSWHFFPDRNWYNWMAQNKRKIELFCFICFLWWNYFSIHKRIILFKVLFLFSFFEIYLQTTKSTVQKNKSPVIHSTIEYFPFFYNSLLFFCFSIAVFKIAAISYLPKIIENKLLIFSQWQIWNLNENYGKMWRYQVVFFHR